MSTGKPWPFLVASPRPKKPAPVLTMPREQPRSSGRERGQYDEMDGTFFADDLLPTGSPKATTPRSEEPSPGSSARDMRRDSEGEAHGEEAGKPGQD